MANRSYLITAGMLVLAAIVGGAAAAIATGVFHSSAPLAATATVAEEAAVSDAEGAGASSPSPDQPASQPAASAPADAASTVALVSPNATKVFDQKRFGDWIYSCLENASAAKSCSILQDLNDAKSDTLLFQWRIVRASDGRLISVWQTPTGVLVGPGIVLDVGTPKPVAVPFHGCTSHNCDAVATLAPDFIASLRVAKSLKAVITSTDSRNLVFTFSPTGLADALAALSAAN